MNRTILDFYRNKKVLITGHTGFKGSWLTKVLIYAGARVYGYSLDAPTTPSIYSLCELKNDMESHIGDIRNLEELQRYMLGIEPDIVFHLAAQPIVRESYLKPVYTYDVNVMGTVNILDCVRVCDSVKSVVNITTDKVYKNREWCWGYRENEELNGFDPYSNSKSCSELVTACYINSFFCDRKIGVSTARAGNVIGGGDFAKDRILPDCLRAIENGENVFVRNPLSIRPYQHVLEPIMAYLSIAKAQFNDSHIADNYNVGPADIDCCNTGFLVEKFCQKWNELSDNKLQWQIVENIGPHEANFLKLDCTKIKDRIGWNPLWHIDTAIEKVAEWDYIYISDGNVNECIDNQIMTYFGE